MIDRRNDQLPGADAEWPDGADFLDLRRPPCPKCAVRTIAREVGGATFECLRCGHVQILPVRAKSALG